MSKAVRKTLLSIVAVLCVSSASRAADDYGHDVATKLGAGVSNLLFCWIEIPKNMINTANQSNVALGLSGGMFKGLLHTAGRAASGMVDFLTFPLPTKPIVHPSYPWENFYTDTTYGPAFKVDSK